ncbi:MAG: hypothetical protein ACRD3W_30775, partial [Terriglobales bacterium]
MERHPDYTRTRLSQLGDTMRALIYPDRRPLDRLTVSPATDRITHAQAQKLKYRRARIGEQFGPLWATFWFRGAATVPPEWAGGRIDLIWISHSEATLWIDGRSAQGLNWTSGDRPDAVLAANARAGEKFAFQIEMACNGKFGSRTSPFASISPYVLDRAEIALFDPYANELYWDFFVLQQLGEEMAADSGSAGSDRAFAGELLFELNRFANTYDPADRSTWAAAHAILKALYENKNGSLVHNLSAIGHAHIDTAWLWPIAETKRKLTRTFSSQVAYMERYPHYKFAVSQAVQYQFVKETNPDLWKRIKAKVKTGQWVPVGGTWVEPDCNIPAGEGLARQFLMGQRFFEREFGERCSEFWNPDVFGYNGQLPQLMRLSGIERFLTQKLSWNRFNRPRFHT